MRWKSLDVRIVDLTSLLVVSDMDLQGSENELVLASVAAIEKEDLEAVC